MKAKPTHRLMPTLALALILAQASEPACAGLCILEPIAKANVWYSCWDCPTQCHGDADCDGRVNMTDLGLLFNYWKIKDPPYDACLDFNRDLKIDHCDEDIMERWFTSYPWGPGPPADCPERPLELQPMDPNALVAGSTYTIEWTDIPSSCPSSYRLLYSIDNGESWVQMEPNEVSDTCSFEWIVPMVDSNQCLLNIKDADASASPYYYPPSLGDTTDEPFTIYECSETLTGDLNRSCYVDFHDLNVLGLIWHIEPSFQTLAELAEQWCGCGNPYDPACGY